MEQPDLFIFIRQLIWVVLLVIAGLSIRKMISQKSKGRGKNKSWFRIEDVEDTE